MKLNLILKLKETIKEITVNIQNGGDYQNE